MPIYPKKSSVQTTANHAMPNPAKVYLKTESAKAVKAIITRARTSFSLEDSNNSYPKRHGRHMGDLGTASHLMDITCKKRHLDKLSPNNIIRHGTGDE